MPEAFLDTNLIVRHVTRDLPAQAERARALFLELETAQSSADTIEPVLSEAVYVLSSKVLYNLPREQIRDSLATIISLPGLRLPNKHICLRALDLYVVTGLDFVDCLCVAHMEDTGIDTILSFDRGFDRIPGIIRREP